MIGIKNISKSFGEKKVLDDISFNVRQGEVLGFLGPNGAGKSTTMKIITSYWEADEGKVEVAGIDVAKDSLRARRKIGYLPENVPLYEEMKVFEYLKFVAEARDINPDRMITRIKEVITSCGLQQVIGQPIDELSKGYRQRVGLAQAIMHDPDILILDEPTTGLDPNQIIEIRDLIKEIGKEKTVIFSTHILAEAQATCDRVIIINKGKIVGEGRPDELADTLNTRAKLYLKVKGEKTRVISALQAMNIGKIEEGYQKDDKCEEKVVDNGVYEYTVSPQMDGDIREKISQKMLDNNFLILEFIKHESSLEDVFIELTK